MSQSEDSEDGLEDDEVSKGQYQLYLQHQNSEPFKDMLFQDPAACVESIRRSWDRTPLPDWMNMARLDFWSESMQSLIGSGMVLVAIDIIIDPTIALGQKNIIGQPFWMGPMIFLSGIVHNCVDGQRNPRLNSRGLLEIQTSFPDILRVISGYPSPDTIQESVSSIALSFITRTLLESMGGAVLVKFLTDSPECVSGIAKSWVACNENRKSTRDARKMYTITFSRVLRPFARRAASERTQNNRGSLVGCDLDRILSCFDRIEKSVADHGHDHDEIMDYLELVSLLYRLDSPFPHSDRILANDRTPRLIKAVRHSFHQAPANFRANNHGYVTRIPDSFQRLLFQDDGPPTSAQFDAIESSFKVGLLNLLVDFMLDATLEDLLDYNSIFEDIEGMSNVPRFKSDLRFALRAAYTPARYHTAAGNHLIYLFTCLQRGIGVGDIKAPKLCSSVICDRTTTFDHGLPLERCSRYRDALYCSVACQKLDWIHRHKDICPKRT